MYSVRRLWSHLGQLELHGVYIRAHGEEHWQWQKLYLPAVAVRVSRIEEDYLHRIVSLQEVSSN
jgi:hypothetical protein